jgi:hypothetical protein
MEKRKIRRLWRRFMILKPWHVLALAILSTVICVYALRANNEHMAKLRTEVYTADQKNGDVKGALTNLQAYVTTHMNTNLSTGANAVYPPIQLKYTYNRLVDEQSQQLATQNSQLYTQAEAYCQQTIPTGFSGRYRVPCIEQYVTSHGLQQPAVDPSLYEFDFVSPVWSPDLAGWSLVVSVVLWILFVIRLAAQWWYKKFID